MEACHYINSSDYVRKPQYIISLPYGQRNNRFDDVWTPDVAKAQALLKKSRFQALNRNLDRYPGFIDVLKGDLVDGDFVTLLWFSTYGE